jgi:protein ImuA
MAVPLGLDAIDQALPWGGLPRGALHVVAADQIAPADAAASGFAAALIGRLCGGGGRALWCLRRGDLYAPGLPALGVDPDRLLVVRARRAEEVLWTLEEALASGRFAAVLGEDAEADLTASRRLQLAARSHGVACLLLDRGDTPAGFAAGVAVTRWLVAPTPGAMSHAGAPTAAGWRLTLARCRGGAVPRHWTIGWCHETRGFVDSAALADRPRPPARIVAPASRTHRPPNHGPASRRAS